MTLYHEVHKEAEQRRQHTTTEVQKLLKVVEDAIKNFHDGEEALQCRTLARIKEDRSMLQKAVGTFFPEKDIPALTSNKMSNLLNGAEYIISEHWDAISGGTLSNFANWKNCEEYPIGQRFYNISTSSLLNFIQTAGLSVLIEESKGKKIFDIPRLQKEGIYAVDNSPNIQGVRVSEETAKLVKDWNWYFKDDKSPQNGEIAFPHVGFFFGGSRQDVRYLDKQFRAEDCSSSVQKWTKAEHTFTTRDMLAVINDMPGQHPDYVKGVLTPLKQDREIKAGDVFVTSRFHTGIVAKNLPDDSAHMATLSYTRYMPVIEGLVYQELPIALPKQDSHVKSAISASSISNKDSDVPIEYWDCVEESPTDFTEKTVYYFEYIGDC
ncbi:hypothetical protein [Candidatus Sneabacter namystus]|nr:hypothetical protein [Candidatus Sneabacter namystus]